MAVGPAIGDPVPLTPGSSTTFLPTATSLPGGPLASFSSPYTGGFISGTVNEEVFQGPSGGLDFFYQVTDNATTGGSASDGLTKLTLTDFQGYATSVDYVINNPAGGTAPTTADRQAVSNGRTIDFNFAANIPAGGESDWVEILTNATMFSQTNGSIGISDGGPTTVGSAPGPAAAPEPATMGLIGGGLALLGAARWRRRAKA